MNKQETIEAIDVMQAYADGQDIEYSCNGSWYMAKGPNWDWFDSDYRIAKPKPVKLAVGMVLRRSINSMQNVGVVAIVDSEVCVSGAYNDLFILDIDYAIANYKALIDGKIHPLVQ